MDPPDPEWQVLLADVLTRLPAYLKLGWALARSPELEPRDKLGLLGGVLYSVSPVDLVPGIIPVLGQLDDLAILLHGIRSALRRCPPGRAEELLQDCGLTEAQLDQDLRTLGKVARGFSGTVAKGAWKGTKAAGKAVGRGVRWGARALREAYRKRRGEG
jgi:uncharacterized membrane protein YkvA (DUF1232 family)